MSLNHDESEPKIRLAIAAGVVSFGHFAYKLVSFPSFCRRYLLKKYFGRTRRILMFERPDSDKKSNTDLKEHLSRIRTDDNRPKYDVHLESDEEVFKEKLETQKFDIITIDYFSEYLEPKIEEDEERKNKVAGLNAQLGQLDTLIEDIRTNMGDVWCTDGHDLALEANKIISRIPINDRPVLAIHSRFARKLATTEEFNKLQGINVSWLWKDKDLHDDNVNGIESARKREVKHLDSLIRSARLRRLEASIKKLSLIGIISGVITIMLYIVITESLDKASPHILSILLGVFASLLVNAISFLISSGNRS
ncbi:TPA: hypothetical protein ACGUW2_003092 [Vibrio vulnificus]